tara:strand:- start:6544 stop:7164 length:621 start_codon:yes stop_codon:yes gene_type:complete
MNYILYFIFSILAFSTHAYVQVIEFSSNCNLQKIVKYKKYKFRESATYNPYGIWAAHTNKLIDLQIQSDCSLEINKYSFDNSYVFTIPTTLLIDKKDTICRKTDILTIFLKDISLVYFAASSQGKLFLNEQQFEMNKLQHKLLDPGLHQLYLFTCGKSLPSKGNGYQNTRWLGAWYQQSSTNDHKYTKIQNEKYINIHVKQSQFIE